MTLLSRTTSRAASDPAIAMEESHLNSAKTLEKNSSRDPIANTAAGKVLLFALTNLSQRAATGRLTVRCGTRMWFLFLEMGCLTWASGREHQGRRWQRQYAKVCGNGKLVHSPLLSSPDNENFSWDYQLCFSLHRQQLLSEEELGKLASGTIREVLFDILQAIASRSQMSAAPGLFASQWDAGKRPSQQCFIPPRRLDSTKAILDAVWQQWSAWKQAGLAIYSPNDVPHIINATRLKAQTTARAFSTMTRLFDGRRTLRDVAAAMNMELHQVATPLMPLILEKIVCLKKTIDRRPGQSQQARETSGLSKVPVARPQPPGQDISVLCIDDSLQCCEIVRHIIESVGCRCTTSQEPLKAIDLCVEAKPDLIFLDLVMPIINGYELCAQLRRMEAFKYTPIVILSGRDGVPDKMRARLSGATDFLSKPIMRNRVVAILEKYLPVRSQ